MPQVKNQSETCEDVWTFPFAGLIAFLSLYYLSPEDFVPLLGNLPTGKIIAAVTLGTVIFRNLSKKQPWLVFPIEAKRFFVFVGIIVIGLPFSIWTGGSVEVFLQRIIPITMFFVIIGNTVQTTKQVHILATLMVACGVLISLVACYHYAIGEVDQFGRLIGYGSKEYENPNDLAMGLLTLIPISAALFSGEHRAARRWVFALAIGIMCAAILASLSRTGMVGLAFLGALMLLNLARQNLLKTALAAILLSILGLAVVAASPTVADRFESIFNDDKDDAGSKAERLAHMSDALTVLSEHPLMGVGIGQSMVAIVAMHDNAANQWVKVHNVYLLLGAELGIPGFCVYVWMIIAVFRALKQTRGANARHHMPEPGASDHLGIGLRHAILVFAITAAFAPVAYNWFLYILIGLASVLMSTSAQRVSSSSPSRNVLRHSLRPVRA
jgi:putative inorganic carbon (hco3(-)) transporter